MTDEQRRHYLRNAWVGVNSPCPECAGRGVRKDVDGFWMEARAPGWECQYCAGLGYVTETVKLAEFVRRLTEATANEEAK